MEYPQNEKTSEKINPYKNSTLIKKLKLSKEKKKPLRIAIFDLDSTLSGKEESIKRTRKKLDDLNFCTVFITARTEEMVMGEEEYKKSVVFGFSRPKPLLGISKGKRYYIDPWVMNPDLVNPDVIAGSTGTQVLLRHTSGGYLVDEDFHNQFEEESEIWRSNALEIIKQIDPEGEFTHLDPIDVEKNYVSQLADVFPPKYRIQINFDNLNDKIKFMKKMQKRNLISTSEKGVSSPVNLIDDSDPDFGIFTIYLTPGLGYKAKAGENIIENICRILQIDRKDLEVIFAGDAYPDLGMLLYCGMGTRATSILVGGSRLSKVLTDKGETTFAGLDISHLKRRLHKSDESGSYIFKLNPSLGVKNSSFRKLIVAEKAYPGTNGPDSILSYLKGL